MGKRRCAARSTGGVCRRSRSTPGGWCSASSLSQHSKNAFCSGIAVSYGGVLIALRAVPIKGSQLLIPARESSSNRRSTRGSAHTVQGDRDSSLQPDDLASKLAGLKLSSSQHAVSVASIAWCGGLLRASRYRTRSAEMAVSCSSLDNERVPVPRHGDGFMRWLLVRNERAYA